LQNSTKSRKKRYLFPGKPEKGNMPHSWRKKRNRLEERLRREGACKGVKGSIKGEETYVTLRKKQHLSLITDIKDRTPRREGSGQKNTGLDRYLVRQKGKGVVSSAKTITNSREKTQKSVQIQEMGGEVREEDQLRGGHQSGRRGKTKFSSSTVHGQKSDRLRKKRGEKSGRGRTATCAKQLKRDDFPRRGGGGHGVNKGEEGQRK